MSFIEVMVLTVVVNYVTRHKIKSVWCHIRTIYCVVYY
jgi:hypothetical protein